MNREKAEKLLAVLLFDDLDASSKEELTAYLQTDDELRERLTDMRMAVKVTSDALENEPELTLSPKRLKKLSRLAIKGNKRSVIFTMRYIATAAAVLAVIALPACFIFMPSLTKVRKLSSSPMALRKPKHFVLVKPLGAEVMEESSPPAQASPGLIATTPIGTEVMESMRPAV